MDSRQYEKALAACDQLLFLSSSPWLVAPITAFASPPTADRRFEAHSAKALAEMWREFPEFAMGVGNYKCADRMTVPNITQRKQSFAFFNRQLAALAKFDASKLCERHTSREAFVDTIRQQIPKLEKFVREKDWVDLNPTRPLVVLGRGLIERCDAKEMLAYRHSGFSVDAGVCIEAHDRAALERPWRRPYLRRLSQCRSTQPPRVRSRLGLHRWAIPFKPRPISWHPSAYRRTICGRF